MENIKDVISYVMTCRCSFNWIFRPYAAKIMQIPRGNWDYSFSHGEPIETLNKLIEKANAVLKIEEDSVYIDFTDTL